MSRVECRYVNLGLNSMNIFSRPEIFRPFSLQETNVKRSRREATEKFVTTKHKWREAPSRRIHSDALRKKTLILLSLLEFTFRCHQNEFNLEILLPATRIFFSRVFCQPLWTQETGFSSLKIKKILELVVCLLAKLARMTAIWDGAYTRKAPVIKRRRRTGLRGKKTRDFTFYQTRLRGVSLTA